MNIIPRVGPHPDTPQPHIQFLHELWDRLARPAYLVSDILQLLHNYRSKTFAGKYKLTAWVVMVGQLVSPLALYIPWVAGEVLLRDDFSLSLLLNALIIIPWVVQALIYPKISQDMLDKDTQ